MAPFNKACTNAAIRLKSLNKRYKITNKDCFINLITYLHRLRRGRARLNLHDKRDLINTCARDTIFLRAI
jgi:hypothetical protein